jgi:hypothetical protein
MGHHDSTLRAVMAVALLLAAACRPSPDAEPKLEAVDVGPALEIDIEGDQQAIQRPPELVGILPEDFPKDLPLYLPASLVEFGTAADGWIYVELLSPHTLAQVESALPARLSKGGWTAAGGQLRQGRDYRKGGRRVRLAIEDAKPGTLYRFEYPP